MNIEQIWSEYRTNLRSFLQSKVADADEVDDLLQQVLIKTHENMHTLKDNLRVKAWLFQIANHAVIDFYRKRARVKKAESGPLWYVEEDETIWDDFSQCVEPFIESLPEESAKLLREIDLNGKSQKQYAQEMKMSYSTLKSQVQKSRSQLRRVFHQCCVFTLDASGRLADYSPKSNDCCNR